MYSWNLRKEKKTHKVLFKFTASKISSLYALRKNTSQYLLKSFSF